MKELGYIDYDILLPNKLPTNILEQLKKKLGNYRKTVLVQGRISLSNGVNWYAYIWFFILNFYFCRCIVIVVDYLLVTIFQQKIAEDYPLPYSTAKEDE